MELSAQIKELEKKASEAEAWKLRYQKIVSEIEQSIKVLSDSIGYVKFKGASPSKEHISPTKRIPVVVERLYSLLFSEEKTEINSEDITDSLRTEGVTINSINTQNVRDTLARLAGVVRVKRGANVVFFYDKTKAINPKEIPDSLKDAVIKEAIPHNKGGEFDIEPQGGGGDEYGW